VPLLPCVLYSRTLWKSNFPKLACRMLVGKAQTKEEAYILARKKGLLCGAWGCNQPSDVDIDVDGDPARVCRNHLDEFRRAERGDPKGRSVIVPLAAP
jgi:hypothetical protein